MTLLLLGAGPSSVGVPVPNGLVTGPQFASSRNFPPSYLATDSGMTSRHQQVTENAHDEFYLAYFGRYNTAIAAALDVSKLGPS